LQEIEDGKRRKEEDQQRRKEEAKARRGGAVGEDDAMVETPAAEAEDEDALLDYEDEEMDGVEENVNDSNPMAALLASARRRANKFDRGDAATSENEEDSDEEGEDEVAFDGVTEETEPDTFTSQTSTTRDSSRKAHDKAFKQVISASDVLLYVLDARDPLSTRSASVEQAITSHPTKRLILILNKIDLVPAPVLKRWLQHLRRSFPTLPLRASSSAPNAKTFDHKHLTPQFTSNTLIKALKSYAAGQQLKRAVTVGVIGYPNVGKSSVINALTSRLSGHAPNSRSRNECPVGAEAGVTTALREVKLDNKLKLVDSPGIVFPSSSTSAPDPSSTSATPAADKSARAVEEQARLILLNALPSHEIVDPVPAVSLLLSRLSASEDLFARLLKVYDLPALMSRPASSSSKDFTTDFLVQVARKRGRLGKGGVPNLHAAAQTVVSDWRDGRIQGWVEAPIVETVVVTDEHAVQEAIAKKEKEAPKMADEKRVVTQWAKEFSLPGLWGDEGVGEVEGVEDGDEAMAGA